MAEINSSKEYDVKNAVGNVIFTIKLIDHKSKIFIGNEEIMVCRFLPIPIQAVELPKYKEIESINDLIDTMDRSLEREELLSPEYSDLDFFVNCSNIEAWVQNDYNTRILDYRLSFPLLKALAERGNSMVKQRFKEEIVERYHFGSKWVKQYLKETTRYLREWLTDEELFSVLPEGEQEVLLKIRKYLPREKCNMNPAFREAITIGLDLFRIENIELEEFIQVQREICKLAHLKRLKISFSYKYYEKKKERFKIIPELGESLTELEELVLSNVDVSQVFDGKHPFPSLRRLESMVPETISKVRSLQEIKTRGGNGNELPASICNVASLKSLNIITIVNVLPQAIGNLKHLEELNIFSNKIRTLPDSFGDLKKLTRMSVEDGELEELPDSFGNLKNLKELKIEKCNLRRLPDSFGNLENLEDLDLSGNSLKKLPNSFSKLNKIKKLNLSRNKFDIFPKEILFLSSLENFDINENYLIKIPEDIHKLSRLRDLGIRGNKIKALPDSLGDLKFLTILVANNNNISELPESIGKLKRLKDLALSDNKITSIPNAICNSISLKKIRFDNNPIKSLPECMAKLPSLESLMVIGTKIPFESEIYYKTLFPSRKIDFEL